MNSHTLTAAEIHASVPRAMTHKRFWAMVQRRFDSIIESCWSVYTDGVDAWANFKPDPIVKVADYNPMHQCPVGYAEHLEQVT